MKVYLLTVTTPDGVVREFYQGWDGVAVVRAAGCITGMFHAYKLSGTVSTHMRDTRTEIDFPQGPAMSETWVDGLRIEK